MDPPFPQFEEQIHPGPGRRNLIRAFVGPEVVSVFAHSLADAEVVIEAVRDGRTVVLNAAGMRAAEARRLLDFACGGLLAINGQIHRVGLGVYLLAPASGRVHRL